MKNRLDGLIRKPRTLEEQIQGLEVRLGLFHAEVAKLAQEISEHRIREITDSRITERIGEIQTVHDHAVKALRAVADEVPGMQAKLNEAVR